MSARQKKKQKTGPMSKRNHSSENSTAVLVTLWLRFLLLNSHSLLNEPGLYLWVETDMKKLPAQEGQETPSKWRFLTVMF
jgi:hypothetical protein